MATTQLLAPSPIYPVAVVGLLPYLRAVLPGPKTARTPKLATVRTNQLVIQLSLPDVQLPFQNSVQVTCYAPTSTMDRLWMLPRFGYACPNSACSQEKGRGKQKLATLIIYMLEIRKTQLILSREKKSWNAVAVGPRNASYITWKGRVEQ
jgi:hypothetical protein